MIIIDVLSWICLGLGSILCIIGGLGPVALARLLQPPARRWYYRHTRSRPRSAGADVSGRSDNGHSKTGDDFDNIVPHQPHIDPRSEQSGFCVGPQAFFQRFPTTKGKMSMTEIIDIVLLSFMIVLAVAISRMQSLFMAAMLMGIFSFLSAVVFTLLEAVDVAFTEAAVGAGVSTVLMLGTLALTKREETSAQKNNALALLVVLITGSALIYGTLDMPLYGDAPCPCSHTRCQSLYRKIGRRNGNTQYCNIGIGELPRIRYTG